MSKIAIDYFRMKMIDLKDLEKKFIPTADDEKFQYNPFIIKNLQKYQPIYSLFFEMTEKNHSEINLKHRYNIINTNEVFDISFNKTIEKPVFIKYSPLYDPIKYLIGKYNTDSDSNFYNLPTINSNVSNCHKKLLNTNNSSYIDGFFCFLSSQILNTNEFIHGIDYYGSYLGIQDKFKMNIYDDYEYLSNSTFFNNSIHKLFDINKNETVSQYMNLNSRRNKFKLNISSSSVIDNDIIMIESISCNDPQTIDESDNNLQNIKMIYQKENENSDKNSESSSSCEEYTTDDEENTDVDNDFDEDDEINTDEDENEVVNSDKDEEESNEEESDEEEMNAYINDFPIQMICLEKCDGTLDELFENKILGEQESIAAMFQIIMILITYQKAFHFTHNDLHTNNIMYIKTDIENIYYKYNKEIYCIPTYGRIYKIIDFGRSIYKFNGNLFCSDSFAPGGDASTQYNFEPYYDDKKPIILPNYSFDLCRLGTSIFDFLFDIDKIIPVNTMSAFQKLIYNWCIDDFDKNILYKRNGEERYPNFKLYKMIARTVHKHLPEKQLNLPIFKDFKISKKKTINCKNIIDIDQIPCYA